MVSRDTKYHALAVVTAVGSLVVLQTLVPEGGGLVGRAVAFVVLYGLVLGGAHLALALRGEDGLVPVASRWRFLRLVAVLLSLGAVAIVTDPVPVGPVTSFDLLAAAAGVAVVGYLTAEARGGYRESTGPP